MPDSSNSAHLARLHAVVSGMVQGVNFRATTAREASALGLRGWVRNLRDGRVEVMAEGQRDQLEAFQKYLWNGPPAASVTGVDVEWAQPTGEFSGFRVRF